MIALVLLAAGRSQRFGGNKLGAVLAGRPLIAHSLDALADAPVDLRIAITGPHTPPTPGYARIALDPADAPQSRSVVLGIAAARAARADAVLIALADMPLVPAAHITALLAAFDGDRLASRGPHGPLPPVLFGAAHFAALASLSGDRGAGALLRDAPAIALSDRAAIDIDTPEDLARAESLIRSPG